MIADKDTRERFEGSEGGFEEGVSLSYTELFYIRLLGDFLHKIKTPADENIVWSELADIARVHGTDGIVYYQLKNEIGDSSVPAAVRTKLFKAYADTCYRYEKRSRLLKELDAGLSEAGIRYLIFKGMDVAALYPMPKLRTMGDTDILVHESDKQGAFEIFKKAGCETDAVGSFEWICHREDISIELHHEMLYDKATASAELRSFFKNAWSYARQEQEGVRCHLTPDFHLMYVIAHLRKHFIDSGAGFRMFLDIAVFLENPEIDREFVSKNLKKLGLWEFAATCFAFCSRWFGTEIPFEIPPVDDDFFKEATKSIIKNGTHGTENPDNLFNALVYLDRRRGMSFFGRLKWRMRLLFPSYRELCGTKRYSFISGRPWMLPAVWVYRGVFLIKERRQNRKSEEDSVFMTKEQKLRRLDYLDKWGI